MSVIQYAAICAYNVEQEITLTTRINYDLIIQTHKPVKGLGSIPNNEITICLYL